MTEAELFDGAMAGLVPDPRVRVERYRLLLALIQGAAEVAAKKAEGKGGEPDRRSHAEGCHQEPPCCERAGEYNLSGPWGLVRFVCPRSCPCHD